MLVGRKLTDSGRKPIFAAALAVLALRGALYPVSNNPYWLVSVQLLDGVGAGIFGALFPLVVADLTRGTGHFNVSQGAIATAMGSRRAQRGGRRLYRGRGRRQCRVPVSRGGGGGGTDRFLRDDAGNVAGQRRTSSRHHSPGTEHRFLMMDGAKPDLSLKDHVEAFRNVGTEAGTDGDAAASLLR